MIRRARIGVVTVGLVCAVSFTATSPVALAARSKQCGSLTGRKWQVPSGPKSGTRYFYGVIGAFTCQSAKTWVAKLINDKDPNPLGIGNAVLKNGPKGYACSALTSKQGYAYAGTCARGPATKPTSGLTWGGG